MIVFLIVHGIASQFHQAKKVIYFRPCTFEDKGQFELELLYHYVYNAQNMNTKRP